MSIWIFFRLIGALALLMFGMKTMSDSLQKMAGPCVRNYDHQSFDGHTLGYAHHGCRTVFYCYDGDDGIIRKCRSPHPCPGYFGYHGCQYRYHAHRLDHECRILIQHHRLCVAGVLHRHHPHL